MQLFSVLNSAVRAASEPVGLPGLFSTISNTQTSPIYFPLGCAQTGTSVQRQIRRDSAWCVCCIRPGIPSPLRGGWRHVEDMLPAWAPGGGGGTRQVSFEYPTPSPSPRRAEGAPSARRGEGNERRGRGTSMTLWRQFTAAYATLLSWLLAVSVAILVIPVSLQIFSRYTALIPSYIWTEEMARFLFIWTIMIGAMIGVRESTAFRGRRLAAAVATGGGARAADGPLRRVGRSAGVRVGRHPFHASSRGTAYPSWRNCRCGSSTWPGP